MDFTSIAFLGFVAALALLYRLVPQVWRCPLIVAASYYFYWISSHWFALLLLAASLAVFAAARSKSFLLMAVSLLITMLVFFKALPLFKAGWLLPLGISYYTFKLAGYLIDVYWGAIEPERRLLPFLAYASFFPQIVAGPIQRPESFLAQVEQAQTVPFPTIVSGVLRILLGFFKKFVIADHLGEMVNYAYRHLTSNPGAPVLFGFYGYPLQMYADFSGLTDIAIGASILFGIEAPENFNAPFVAATPSEYWRRWHITLTQWLTDYVFTPLRMSLRAFGNSGLVFSLFVNMILIGLWHGFRWTFALFGIVHAIYLSVDALSQKARKRWYKNHPLANRVSDWLAPLITFHLVAVAFVFFRAGDISTVISLFSHLLDGLSALQPQRSLVFLALAWLLMECADWLRRRVWLKPALGSMPRWGRWSVYSCTAAGVLVTVFLILTSSQKSSPFLYAIF